MPRGKARFSGGTESPPQSVSEDLKTQLRALCPPPEAKTDKDRAFEMARDEVVRKRRGRKSSQKQPDKYSPRDPRDEFVEEVLREADSVADRLDSLAQSTTKADLGAEVKNIKTRAKNLKAALKLLKVNGLQVDLRGLSVDVLSLLGPEPIELDCADALGRLEMQVETAINALDTLLRHLAAATTAKIDEHCRRKANKRTKEHDFMVDAAIRVLRIAKKHGMPLAATYNAGHSKTSHVVKLLTMLGPIMGMKNSEYTWLKIIKEARAKDPSLNQSDTLNP